MNLIERHKYAIGILVGILILIISGIMLYQYRIEIRIFLSNVLGILGILSAIIAFFSFFAAGGFSVKERVKVQDRRRKGGYRIDIYEKYVPENIINKMHYICTGLMFGFLILGYIIDPGSNVRYEYLNNGWLIPSKIDTGSWKINIPNEQIEFIERIKEINKKNEDSRQARAETINYIRNEFTVSRQMKGWIGILKRSELITENKKKYYSVKIQIKPYGNYFSNYEEIKDQSKSSLPGKILKAPIDESNLSFKYLASKEGKQSEAEVKVKFTAEFLPSGLEEVLNSNQVDNIFLTKITSIEELSE